MNKTYSIAGKSIFSIQKVVSMGGSKTLGRGPGQALGTENANFPLIAQNASNGVNQAQATSSTITANRQTTSMPWMSTSGWAVSQVAGAVGRTALGVAASAYGAVPDLGMVASRAAGYYGASVMGGRMNRTSLAKISTNALRGGITGEGQDAASAAVLVNGLYYNPGSSAFKQTMGEVGGAAFSMNMPNTVAAAAIGGMYTGQTGASLAAMGVTNMTPGGKMLPEKAIIDQMYARYFPTRNGVSIFNRKKLTGESVQTNFQQVVDASLAAGGYTADQRQIIAYQFAAKAEGKPYDLSTMKQDPNNPINAAMQITSSQTNLMQTYEKPMLEGFQAAADVITKTLNPALANFATELGHAKGFLQGLNGSSSGQGAIGVVASVAGGAATAVGAAFTLKRLKKFFGGVDAKESSVAGDLAPVANNLSLLAKAGKFLKMTPLSGFGLQQDKVETHPGDGPDKNQSFMDRLLHGNRYVPKGGGTGGFGASFGPKGGGSGSSPLPGVASNVGFGAVDPGMWGGAKNYHTGEDYPVPEGTPVRAAADGVVFDDAPGFEFGMYIQIDHQNGYQTLYGHLSSKSVSVGETVTKGQVIGKSGATGNVTGPHLHFEVRKGQNNPVDPSEFLGSSLFGASSPVGGGAGTPSPVSAGTGAASSGATSSGKSTVSANDWSTNFLTQIGAPATADNLKVMGTWMAWENGWKNQVGNRNNPLNTTLTMDGSTSTNSVGVQKYASQDQGIAAAIATLTGNKADARGYSRIVSDLKSGKSSYANTWGGVRDSAWVSGHTGQGSYGGGTGGFGASIPSNSSSRGAVNYVNINLTLQNASDSDARNFVKQVKSMLEEDNHLALMGGK